MKNAFTKIALGALLAAPLAFAVPAVAAPTCTATNFYRDGINMTAAIINPSATVTGDVDATGCNIGVYYGPGTTGTVLGATIHGANYFGVVVRQAAVNVTGSNVNTIGETPLNGTQHGVAVYYATVSTGSSSAQPTCSAGTTTGTVSGNTISSYQKGGIVVNCTGSNVTVSGNTVAGQGPVNYIAQNGIQVSRGAAGTVKNNTVTGNQYSGTNYASSAGILIYGGCGDALVKNVSVAGNNLTNNDVGVYSFNANDACSGAPSTKTSINIANNTIANSLTTNYNGWDGVSCGYQAGISDSGNHDSMTNNKISGVGYQTSSCSPVGTVGMQSAPIDTSFWSDGARVHKNAI